MNKVKDYIEYLPSRIQQDINVELIGIPDEGLKQNIYCFNHEDNSKSAVFFYSRGNMYCSACAVNWEPKEWISLLTNISEKELSNLKKIKKPNDFNSIEIREIEKLSEQLYEEDRIELSVFGIKPHIIKDLKVFRKNQEYFSVPVIVEGVLQDTRSYYPNKDPKWTSGFQNSVGFIVPYDIWKNSTEPTYICEGEKDMLIARSLGLNAICITGGCKMKPIMDKCFANREVYILYDNDEAGIEGAESLAKWLLEAGAKVKNVINFHEALEHKEDIYDFFIKYGYTVDDLNKYIEQTEWWTLAGYFKPNKNIATVNEIMDDSEEKLINKKFSNEIQVIYIEQEKLTLPTKAIIREESNSRRTGFQEVVNQEDVWVLDYVNKPKMIFDFIDKYKRFKDENVAIIRSLVQGKHSKKINVEITQSHNFTFGKVRDYSKFNSKLSNAGEKQEIRFVSSSPLRQTRNYLINFTNTYDQTKAGDKVISIYEAKDLNNYDGFILTKQQKELLKQFQVTSTIEDKVKELYNRACDNNFLSKICNRSLWEYYELIFCSPLEYKINNSIYRAAIHATIVGDSQVGKSTTLKYMIETYQHGERVNAKLATLTSLVGGSEPLSSGKSVIRAGELPLNHKGLVALEEIHGSNLRSDYFQKITEVKSSGIARISRIKGGTIDMPCMVRMIEIANPQATSISSYSNAYEILRELVGRPEDIARIDLIGIFSNETTTTNVENKTTLEMFDKEAYVLRIKWIWSRKAEQIKFEYDQSLFDSLTKDLANTFLFEAQIFGGANASHRLLRLACAYAGMVVSTDKDFQNIIVRNEHLLIAYNYFKEVYTSKYYKLDSASKKYRELREFAKEDIEAWSNLYSDMRDALKWLANKTTVDKTTLDSFIDSADKTAFYRTINKHNWVIKQTRYEVIASERLVKLIEHINRKAEKNEANDN